MDEQAIKAARRPGQDLSDFISRPSVKLREFPGLRALVADDNATNRLILRTMLERLGVVVTLAEDGGSALRLWRPQEFDVIMLDIAMPQLCGVATLRALREMAANAGVALPPTLAVTANASGQSMAEYRAAGFIDVVAKPALLADLSAALARIVTEI